MLGSEKMKSLYITSVERFSGKTAACLALGKQFQQDGMKIGYLKPLSLQPWRIGDKLADEDAAYVIEALNLNAKPWDLSPVVVTSEFLENHLKHAQVGNLMDKVMAAKAKIPKDTEILLLEGGGSLREGYIVGLPSLLKATSWPSLNIGMTSGCSMTPWPRNPGWETPYWES